MARVGRRDAGHGSGKYRSAAAAGAGTVFAPDWKQPTRRPLQARPVIPRVNSEIRAVRPRLQTEDDSGRSALMRQAAYAPGPATAGVAGALP